MIVTRVTPDRDDYVEWVVYLTQQFIDETSIYSQLDFNPDKYRDYVYDMTSHPMGVCLMAIDGDTPVGYVLFEFDQTYIDKINIEVITFYVAPSARGTKAGRLLVQNLCTIADMNNADYMQLCICAEFFKDSEKINQLTANLFAKYGFKETGIVMGRKQNGIC